MRLNSEILRETLESDSIRGVLGENIEAMNKNYLVHPTRASLRGKRVVLVLGWLQLGGAERQAILLAKYLRNVEKADAEIWCMIAPGRAAEICEEYGIPWRLVPFNLKLRGMRWRYEVLRYAIRVRKLKPDVLMPYTLFPNIICGLIWRIAGARICIWNQRDVGIQIHGGRSEGLAVRQSHCFISNSQAGAELLASNFGVSRNRIHVVANGVEIGSPVIGTEEWREKLGVDRNTFVACMVANLTRFKDHETLIKAWRIVVDVLAGTSDAPILILAGWPDESFSRLQALAYNLELGQSVRFLGAVNDIWGLLAAVDLGVFSSKLEACPNGVLECMAAGLAVTGTDTSGVREAIGPQEYDLLAPIGDSTSLAERIIKLALDKQLRRELGQINQKRILNSFNPTKMCERTIAIIATCLNGRRTDLLTTCLARETNEAFCP